MAEATAMRNNATDYPVYGLPYTVAYPMLDADGDLITGASTPDAEVSLNGDTFADCTNESTEIATSSGIYYLTLTAAEMTADIVSIIAKSATAGMKTTSLVLYPRKLPILLTSDNAGAYDSTTTINLGASAVAIDDYYNGCLVYIYGGTGSGQVRMITDYAGSTKLATVHVAWATNPDATSDLKIYRTEQAPYVMGANLTAIAGNSTNATNLGTAASNYSTTRGLSGTALPAAAADAAGGLVISDAGGLDIDATALRVLRTFYINNNKMNVTNATGVVVLRNDTDTGNLATGSLTDNLTTTTRTALTWA